MRRLFQECKIGTGNAAVLSDALLGAKPEDLKRKDVIKVRTYGMYEDVSDTSL